MQTLETGNDTNLTQSQIHPIPERTEAEAGAPAASASSVFQEVKLPSPETAAEPKAETAAAPEMETSPENKQTESLAHRLRRGMDAFILERPKEDPQENRWWSKGNAVSSWMGTHEYLLTSLLPAVVWAASMPSPNGLMRGLNFALALGAAAMTPLAYEASYAADAKSEVSKRAWLDHMDSLIVAPAFVPMTAIYAASKAVVRGARFVAGLFNEETLAKVREFRK